MNNFIVARRKLLQFGAIALGTGIVTRATASQALPFQKKETLIDCLLA